MAAGSTCQTCAQRSLARRKKNSESTKKRSVDPSRVAVDRKSTEQEGAASPVPQSTAKEEVALALFFPDTSLVTPSVRPSGGFNMIGENTYSTEYLMANPTDGPFHELLKLLRSARTSLDLCIYVLSFPPLCDAILELYDKHSVLVRIIVDGREDEALRSQIPRLQRRGIEIRCNEKSFSILMHNKFAIIDSSLLLTGSLNWTKSAVLLNHDNVLVTSNKSLVEQYSTQFSRLWSKFKAYGSS